MVNLHFVENDLYPRDNAQFGYGARSLPPRPSEYLVEHDQQWKGSRNSFALRPPNDNYQPDIISTASEGLVDNDCAGKIRI